MAQSEAGILHTCQLILRVTGGSKRLLPLEDASPLGKYTWANYDELTHDKGLFMRGLPYFRFGRYSNLPQIHPRLFSQVPTYCGQDAAGEQTR